MRWSFPSVAFTAVLLLTSFATDVTDAACAEVKVRRELRELTPDQRQAYWNAIKKLQSATPQPNEYDKLINFHTTHAAEAHGTPIFLPWHRAYMQRFQELITAIDPTVVIPYWDWGADSQAPETSLIFSKDWYGGNGVGDNNCVQDGQFKDYKPYYPTPGSCFSRKFDGNTPNTIGAFFSSESVAKIQSESTTYDAFRRAYEATAHARVHNGIGSSFAHMVSPGDAIFYVHHTLVDKHWAEWQALGHKTDYGPTDSSVVLQPWGVTVASTFDTTVEPYCYTYSNLNKVVSAPKLAPDASGINDKGDMGASLVRRNYAETKPNTTPAAPVAPATPNAPATPATAPVPAGTNANEEEEDCEEEEDEKPKQPSVTDYRLPNDSDRTNLLALRVPTEIPDAWIKMNGLNQTDVRKYEAQNLDLVKALNSVPGYISKCAIFNRPDVLAKLLKTANDFVGYVGSQKLHFNATCTSNPVKAAEEIVLQVAKSVKTVPDTKALAKAVSPQTLELINGYAGGVSFANLTNKAQQVVTQLTNNTKLLSSDNVAKLISKFTVNSH